MNTHRFLPAILLVVVLAACGPAPVAVTPAAPPADTAAPPTDAAPAVAPLAFPAIAFYGNRTGDNEIYAMNLDGSGQVDLTNNPANDLSPAWSPDRSRIAFTSDRDGNNEVYIMNADGSDQVNLTKNAADDGFASWSPDGKQIAFNSNRGQTASAGGAFGAMPTGALNIAYHSSFPAVVSEAGTIYVTNADGSGEASVLVAYPAGLPSWLPNGKQVAFDTNFFGGNGEIWIINLDGTGLERIGALAHEYAWSPDGKYVAYSSWRDNIADSLKVEIYVMNADGSNTVKLTEDGKRAGNPTWSPDGKQIVFNSDVDGSQQIYVMNADGSGRTNLSNAKGYNVAPVWSTK